MKIENPYLKILIEKYISLIVIPIVIVSGIFLYAYVKGIAIKNECEVAPTVVFFFYIVFFGIQIILMLNHVTKENYPEAFNKAIRLIVIFAVSEAYIHLLADDFTRKLENFHNEKRYYLRQLEIVVTRWPDGKGSLYNYGDFRIGGSQYEYGVFRGEGSYTCSIYYDGSDSLLDPSDDHRGLGTVRNIHSNGYVEKIGQIPIKIKKIEPKFYYVCRDLHNKTMFNTTIEDNK